jgi:vacuolar-type H+-ATPase subunit I/STV1
LIYTMGQHARDTHKSARVTTNDTLTGFINISFKGKGWLETDTSVMLDVNPRALDFGPLGEKRRTKLEAKIKNLSEEKMELAVVDYPAEFFKEVELSRDKLKPGKTAKLKVRLERETEDQRFQKSITLEAKGDTLNYRFTVPVQKGIESKVAAKKTPKADEKKTGAEADKKKAEGK